jgi:hypothetical protein
MSSTIDNTNKTKSPNDQQYDHLLVELESSDTNTVALVLRSLLLILLLLLLN